MMCLRPIIVGLLGCMGQISASHHDIKNNIKEIDIAVKFSAVTNGRVSPSSHINLQKCLKLGIKATIDEQFVIIDDIKEFDINQTIISIVHSKMDLHDPLLFYDLKNNKRIEDFEELRRLKEEHKDVITFIQVATFGLNAIPVHLLTSQDRRDFNLGNNTCKVIVMNQAPIKIGEETYNIIVSAFQEDVYDFKRRKAYNDKVNIQLKNQSSSYISYLKKPFFGLLLIAVCYAIYHNLYQ